jgi:hypothetical protein
MKVINPWNIKQSTVINFRRKSPIVHMHALKGLDVSTICSPAVIQVIQVWQSISGVTVATAAVILSSVDVSYYDFFCIDNIFHISPCKGIQWYKICTVWRPVYWSTSSILSTRKPSIQSMVNLKTELRLVKQLQLHFCFQCSHYAGR